MLKRSLLSRQSEVPMESPICLCPGRDDQAQIFRSSWRSCILTGCSACIASAPLPQEMATTAQRLFRQTNFFALESVVIQPLAFINVLSELVNFILNEACQVNPPASVTLTNNSTFPLFPWLIISKKWQNLLRIFSLKSTDMVKGASVWMKIFQSYEHMKNWFYDGTRILNSITKALLQLYSYVWRQSFPLSAAV